VHREFSVSANYSSNNFAAKTKALLKTSFCASRFVSPAALKALLKQKKMSPIRLKAKRTLLVVNCF